MNRAGTRTGELPSDLAGDLAGRLTVSPGASLPDALRGGRRDWAPRVGRGKPATALPDLLASLFNLCSHAHRLCSQLAINAAVPEVMTAPADVAMRLRNETAQEHVRRIGLDWPRLLDVGRRDGQAHDRSPGGRALATLRACPLLRSAATTDDPWPATRDWLQRDWLQMSATDWLQAWHDGGADWLRDWSGNGTGWLAALVHAAREADTGGPLDMTSALRVHGATGDLRDLSNAMAATPAFDLRPQWRGRDAHTGSWSRLLGEASNRVLTPWALLGCRLAELARLCLPDAPGASTGTNCLSHGALTIAPGRGLAWVEMARGLLVHQVTLASTADAAPVLVTDCQVLPPTAWNFHAEGVVALRISGLAGLPAPEQGRRVALLMAAFDPCVPFDVAAGASPADPAQTLHA